jgi:hypothetical protein
VSHGPHGPSVSAVCGVGHAGAPSVTADARITPTLR